MIIALPIADRRASLAFYQDAFDLEAFGDPADDGVPEPLQFRLATDLTMMLIPKGGFGWVIGDAREVASPKTSECVLTLPVADVDAVMAKAVAAGATVVTPQVQMPWGYSGTIADPDGHVWQLVPHGTKSPGE
jgi:uncharacterized glyoxalase superfamily protein PhnB